MLNTIYNNAPQPWQIGFQDSAAPGFTGIVELHYSIFLYLVVICVTASNKIYNLFFNIDFLFYFIVLLFSDHYLNNDLLLLFSVVVSSRHRAIGKTFFHSTSVLNANLPPLVLDPDKEKRDLEEIKKDSEFMSATEFNETIITPYKEAFPLLAEKSKAQREELIKNSTDSLIKASKESGNTDIFSPLYPIINKKGDLSNLEVTNVKIEYPNSRVKDILDKTLNEQNFTVTKNVPIIERIGDKILIDINKTEEVFNSLYDFYVKHPELLDFTLPGISSLLIYRTVVNAQAKTAFVDPDVIKDPNLKLDYLKFRAQNVRMFNTINASLIALSLFGLSYTLKQLRENKFFSFSSKAGGSNITPTLSSSNAQKSFSLLTFLRTNKYFKFFLFLIFVSIIYLFPNIMNMYLNVFNYKYFIYVKVIGVVFVNTLIIYNLSILYYLNKFSSLENLKFNRYTPSFIKSHFRRLFYLSKHKYVYALQIMVIRYTIFCMLTQTVVYIFLLIMPK